MSGVSIATGVIATDALGGGVGRGLQSPGVLAQSAVPASVTGTLSETTLATIVIPAGVMGANGSLRVTLQWSCTNTANTKTAGVRLGGQSIRALALTNTASRPDIVMLTNRGATNSQVGVVASASAYSNSSATSPTYAIDMSQAQSLTITGTLTNTGETITLESYTVEVLNP